MMKKQAGSESRRAMEKVISRFCVECLSTTNQLEMKI